MNRLKALSRMFAAFRQSDKSESIAVYHEMTKDIPEGLLTLACQRAITTCKYLPSVAEILESAKSLAEASKATAKTSTWDEAWAEIQSKMQSTPWGKTPEWSSEEIRIAVNSFGWNALQSSLEKDMPIIRAQVRGLYESACKRVADRKLNEYLLGNDGIGKIQAGQQSNKYLPDGRKVV